MSKNTKKYIGRKIYGVQDMELFKKAHEKGANILLKGPTGSAKTTVVKEYAKENGHFLVSIPCSVAADPSSLFGKYVPKENDNFFEWADGMISGLVRKLQDDKEAKGVLLLDEINMLDPRIAATMFSLLDFNKQVTILDHSETLRVKHNNLLVVGTMNPNYRGTRELNSALANRFAYTINWGYSSHVEKQLCPSTALLSAVSSVRSGYESGSYNAPFSTNMIIEFMDSYSEFGFDFAVGMASAKFDEDSVEAINKVFMVHKKGIISELEKASKVDVNTTGSFKPPVLDDITDRKLKLNFGWDSMDIVGNTV